MDLDTPTCRAPHPTVEGLRCSRPEHGDSEGHTSAAEGTARPRLWYADGHEAIVCDCGQTACIFCDGGLFACVRCGSFEGATTTECPGEKMTADQRDAVYAGTLDFRDGAWRPGACSRHTPAFWSMPEGLSLSEQYRTEREARRVV